MSDAEIAGHRFRDPALLETALTHSSYIHEHSDVEGLEDFERLEFLGDAVVDLVIGEELYRRFPKATEGELTALRAQLVSSAALAEIAAAIDLPARARLGRGEEDSGGRERIGLAASLYESLVGAIHLEGGLVAARAFIDRTMGSALTAAERAPRKTPKTVLQEWAQAERQPLPVYNVVDVSGPDHRRDFVVQVEVGERVAQGSGASKREAQEQAASRMLEEVLG